MLDKSYSGCDNPVMGILGISLGSCDGGFIMCRWLRHFFTVLIVYRDYCVVTLVVLWLVLFFTACTSAGLVHRWNLDEASGDFPDLTGSCDGLVNGVIQRPSEAVPSTVLPGGGTVSPARYLQIDGTGSNYVDFGSDNSLSPDHLSVAFWIRASADPGVDYTDSVILSKHGGESPPSSWEFGFSDEAVPRLQFVSWGGSSKVYTRSNRFTVDDFQDGQWHHVVGTCDGSLARLYVDGALLELSMQTGTMEKTYFPLYLGRRSYDGVPDSWAFPGDVGGPLLIYDHALSDADIAAMVEYIPPSPDPSLQARWDLDQVVTGTTPKVLGPADGRISGNMLLADGGPPTVALPGGTQVESDKHFVCGGEAGDNINFGSDESLSPREITVALWAKAAGDHSGQVLLAKRDDSQGSYELGFDSADGEMSFTVYVGSSSAAAGSTVYGSFDPFDAADFNDGQWHHLVGTHDGMNTSFYVDGELIDNPGNRGFVNDTGGMVDLLIGDNGAVEGDPFDGLIGGPLLLFDYAFSSADVTAMFENTSPQPMPGDADGDGDVDVSDLGILATNYGMTDGAQWGDADFNDDHKVDVTDLGILATAYGRASSRGVPEPSTLSMLAVLCGLMLWRRRGW